MGRHNQHHLVAATAAATAAAPRASVNLGLIVVLSVGSRGGNGRGQGVVVRRERERDRFCKANRGEKAHLSLAVPRWPGFLGMWTSVRSMPGTFLADGCF